ncbi:MAG TPA: C-type lectin domain-containing protein, partial [Thermomicrobiales bacterium]|nr:C-type lectin domain-containing protein [Thermomicrobiales bacterium]
ALCGSDAATFACGGGPAGTQTSNAAGNVVQGNLVGTNAAGTGALGNTQKGVSIDGAPDTVVGGPLGGDRNVIAATLLGPGIVVFNPGADGNLIRGNYIGTDATGFGNLGNNGPGVLLADGANTVVSGVDVDRTAPNRIMFNTGAGIEVTGGGPHKLRINQFQSNGDLGIRDNAERLAGGPTLTQASVGGGVVTVSGTLFGAPNTPYTIDLYVSTACDPSGFGEGASWFGAVVVTPPVEGPASFSAGFGGNVVAPGQIVTALATTGDHVAAANAPGSTSPFSGCQMALPPGFVFSAPSAGGNGHVYEYVPVPGSWTTARTAASSRLFRSVAGHLVTIGDAIENGIVGGLRSGGDLRGWIGLTDEAVNGSFGWITGEPLGYTNWFPGEPSNGLPAGTGGEDYVEIFSDGRWNDQAVDGRGLNQGYVVEYEVNPFFGPPPD